MWDKLALILLVIGGVNWGLVGIFEFDLVAWLFGGATSALSRIVYILVAFLLFGVSRSCFGGRHWQPMPLNSRNL